MFKLYVVAAIFILVIPLIIGGLILKFWYISLPLLALIVWLIIRARKRRTRPTMLSTLRGTQPKPFVTAQTTVAAQTPEPTAEDIAGVARLMQELGPDYHPFVNAASAVITARSGSMAILQRKLGVGFTEARRLMGLLETHGIVGATQGTAPREVLVTMDQLPEALWAHT